MSEAPLDTVRCLSFDCYGTLIDWDGGIRGAAARLASLAGADLERFLEERERADMELTREGYLPYDEVLRRSLAMAAAGQGREVTGAEAETFAESMGAWPPFPDTVAALQRLRARFRLAILSNVRTAVLERSVAQLGVDFDALVTAEQLRSYKPRRAHFDEGLARLGVEREAMLHVAGSLYHDVAPVLALGWRCCFVDRRGDGAPTDVQPTLQVRTLAELADRLGV